MKQYIILKGFKSSFFTQKKPLHFHEPAFLKFYKNYLLMCFDLFHEITLWL